MFDFEKQKHILQHIAKARNAIKRKYNQLKYDKSHVDKVLSETFKPIVKPLERIADKENVNKVKKYDLNKRNRTFEDTFVKSDKIHDTYRIKNAKVEEKTADEDSEENYDSTVESFDETIRSKEDNDADDEGEEMDEYLQIISDSNSNKLDRIYGVRLQDNVFKLGDSVINFTSNYIMINNEKYQKTRGLMELLVKKTPNNTSVSHDDFENYKKILLSSRACLKKDGTLRNSSSNKFRDYIEPMMRNVISKNTSTKKGYGILPSLSSIGTTTIPFKIAMKKKFICRLQILGRSQ